MPRSFMIEEHVSMNLKKGRIEGKEIINPVYQKKKKKITPILRDKVQFDNLIFQFLKIKSILSLII